MAHISVKKRLHLSVICSKLLYCSQFWRPHLKKDIMLLERVQRGATKYILGNYTSNYKDRLLSLPAPQLSRDCLNSLLCAAFEKLFEFFLCTAFERLFEFFILHSFWETVWIFYFAQLLRDWLNFLLCAAFERLVEFFTLRSFWETVWIFYYSFCHAIRKTSRG